MNRPSHRRGIQPRLPLPLVLLALSGAALAQQPSPDLGLDEVAALAVRQQPQLLAQQAAIHALGHGAPAAGELPDPRLNLGVANLPTNSFSFTQEPMTMATIGVSQMIPGGDKRRLARTRVEREAAQAEQVLAATSRRIARDAQLAWLDVYLPGAALGLVRQVESDYQRQVEWSHAAYKAGKLAQEETLAVRGMLEATRDRLADLTRQQAMARAGLARWVGQAAERPLDALPHANRPAPLADMVTRLPGHPELSTLDEAVSVAQADVSLAREAYKPDWSVDLSYGLRGGGLPDFVSVGVGVDLPLFTANRQDKRLAARLAEVEQAELIRADRYRTLKADLEASYADWQAADARVMHYEQGILPLATRRIESALAAYGSDRASYGQVLDARRAEAESRLQWLALVVARDKARVQIDYFAAP